MRAKVLHALSPKRLARRLWPPLAFLAILVGLWELAARWDVIADALSIEPFLVPAPSDVISALADERELLAEKPVLLLDEPFAALDAITRAEMQEWLAGALAAEARTVVLVSHDVEEALYLCDRVVVLSARPARVVAELAGPAPRATPRDEAVATTPFVSARERALRALREGMR